VVAKSMFDRANIIGRKGDLRDEEIRANEDLIGKYGGNQHSNIQVIVARAMAKRAALFSLKNDLDGEIVAWDDLIARFSGGYTDEQESIPREWTAEEMVANAMLSRAVAIGKKGDSGREIAAYDEIITKYAGQSGRLDNRYGEKWIAEAMFVRAIAIGKKGNYDGAIRACDELIVKYGGPGANVETQGRVADAMAYRVAATCQKGNLDGTVRALDEFIMKYGVLEMSFMSSWEESVARLISNCTTTFSQKVDMDGVIRACDELAAKHGESEHAGVQEYAATAMAIRACVIGKKGDPDGYIRAYDELIAMYSGSENAGIQRWVAWAMVKRAAIIGLKGDLDGAIRACDELIAKYGGCKNVRVYYWRSEAESLRAEMKTVRKKNG